MNWIIKLLILGLGLSLVSCNDDLDLVTDWKEIPVVWGFLNASDTAQYIRIEKAFIDGETGADILAKNPDSLYFQDINVQLVNESNGQIFQLQRVDGNLEGYPREPGFFADSPNYLYKLPTPENSQIINADQNYRLEIRDNQDRLITSATTPAVGVYEMSETFPMPVVRILYSSNLRIQWKSTEQSAWFYDLDLVMYIDEYEIADPTNRELKKLTWKLERGKLRGNSGANISSVRPGVDFYKFIAGQLDADPLKGRRFLSMDIVVDAGAKAISDFLSVGSANAGITGAEFVPSFSNIDNGVGLFSSRTRLVASGYTVDVTTRDSLRSGIYTQDLNFE
jgi:hypothetical protein